MAGIPHSESGRHAQSYMGETNGALKAWAANFADKIDADFIAYGLTAADAASIRAVTDQYIAAYALVTSPTTNTKAATIAKDGARKKLEAICRPFAMQIKANPHIPNALKSAAQIRLNKSHHTSITVPRSRPVLTIDTMDWTGFVLRFHDLELPDSRRKPDGAAFLLLVGQFARPNEFDDAVNDAVFVDLLSRSPQRVTFPPAVHRGLAARYYGCWVTARGERGPWSTPLEMPAAFGGVSAAGETESSQQELKLPRAA